MFSEDDVDRVAMSGYSDYIMSASSSIADIVNNASTAAAAAAGQVACQVSPNEMLNLHLIIVTILHHAINSSHNEMIIFGIGV